MNFTEKILGCHPLSGNNKDLEKILTEEFAEYNCDVNTDALGNIFFTKKFGEGKNIMLCTPSDVPGVVAVYADKSRIYVGELGGVNIQRLANCKVVFDGASGIFTVPSSTASIGDCYVETYDEKAQEKVNLGDKGYFDMPVYSLESGIYSGYGVPAKMCVVTLTKWAHKLLSQDGEKELAKDGIGSVTFAFLGQSSLMSRGAFVASYGVNPDVCILLSSVNASKVTPEVKKDVKYVVKMLDKAYVCDTALTESICRYFDDNKINFAKTINADVNPALNGLSRAETTPTCGEICIPVFGDEAVIA